MIRKFLTFGFAVLFIHSVSYAQEKEDLARSLAYVSTGNSFASQGNFAALSTSGQTLTASIFLIDNRDMFTFTASAGAVQGIQAIFDEGELNSNVSIAGEYRRIITDYNLGKKSGNELDVLDVQLAALQAAHDKKMLALLKKVKKDKGNTKIASDQSALLLEVNGLLRQYTKEELSFNKPVTYEQLRITDLRKIKERIEADTTNTVADYYALMSNVYGIDFEKKKKAIEQKQNQLKSKYINLHYLAVGYKATNSLFVRFLENQELANQLAKTEYVSHNVTLSYNFISNIKNLDQAGNFEDAKRRFLSIGGVFSRTNNQASLTQVTVTDTQFENLDQGRVVETSQNAFKGNYLEDINQLTAFVDYYTYLDKNKDAFALHLNPTMVFNELLKPVASFQFGVLIPFKNKDKQTAVTNIEIFYKIKDVFNTTENSNSLLNRNIIGLQTSFPFYF